VFHDPFPSALLPYHNEVKWDSGQKVLLRRMNKVVENADAVWLPSKRLIEWMAPFYPNLESKSVVMPHLATLPQAISKLPNKVEWPFNERHPDHFVLLHMGSLLPGRSPKGLLNATIKWLETNPESRQFIRLVFVGWADRMYSDLLAKASAAYPENIIVSHSRVPYAVALHLQKQASVNIILEVEGNGSPQLLGKVADAVWADRPIMLLGSPASEARRVFGKDYPWQAENEDFQKIFSFLDELFVRWKSGNLRDMDWPQLKNYMSGDNMIAAVKEMLHES